MSVQILEESRFLLYCFISGIIITVIYDIFRIFRRIIRHGTLLIALEDILFWIAASAFLFFMLYLTNNGIIRWFSVAGACIGMLVYKFTVGEHFVQIMSTIVNSIQHLVLRFLKWMLRPIKRMIKRVLHKIKRGLAKTKRIVKKKLTGNIKKVKIILCKHKKERKKRKSQKTNDKSKRTEDKNKRINEINKIKNRYGDLL